MRLASILFQESVNAYHITKQPQNAGSNEVLTGIQSSYPQKLCISRSTLSIVGERSCYPP